MVIVLAVITIISCALCFGIMTHVSKASIYIYIYIVYGDQVNGTSLLVACCIDIRGLDICQNPSTGWRLILMPLTPPWRIILNTILVATILMCQFWKAHLSKVKR